MKRLLTIILVLSLSLNLYLVLDHIDYNNKRAIAKTVNQSMGLSLTKTKWGESVKIFQAKLKEKKLLKPGKRYFYINIWTSWCMPCIREIPWLDSLAGNLGSDVGYVFVSDLPGQVA